VRVASLAGMSRSSSSRSVRREIDAAAGDVYRVLVTPSEHHRFDASNMVGRAVTVGPVSRVGDVFTMEMAYSDSSGTEHYRTDNVVTALDQGRCVEWAVAPAGEEPLGWRWRYELKPCGADRTEVTLTYDWTGTPAPNLLRFGVPLFDEAELAASLDLLADTITNPPR